MSATEADKIERAADRIAAPGAWTQWAVARDKDGVKVPSKSPAAVCWCALGALNVEGVDLGRWYDHVDDAQTNLWSSYNDAPGRTQSEVVARMRELAAQVRSS